MSKLNDFVVNVALSIIAVTIGYVYGAHYTHKKFDIERTRINLEAQAKYDKLVADTNKEQSDSKERIKELETNAERVELNAKITIDNLRNDVRNRVVRVSVPVASCTANTDTGSGAVVPDNDQARAELLPETVLDLINIAADANSEVRRTNLCIDRFNEVKAMLERLRNNKVE